MKAPKSFEEAICRLEEILVTIADEQTPITQAVKLYADAAKLLEYSNTALQKATLQIKEIDESFGTLSTVNDTVEDDIL